MAGITAARTAPPPSSTALPPGEEDAQRAKYSPILRNIRSSRPSSRGTDRHPPETWMRDLDGRCTAVRYTDAMRTLEVFCDPMGSYPVFAYEAPGVIWISNNAEVLRSISGSSELRLEALAGMLGGGWSLS